MFLEFHGYIIDPKSRYIDMSQTCSQISGWKQFGQWEICSEGIRCSAGWMVASENRCKYFLSQYPGLIQEYSNGSVKEITWYGPPPNEGCNII